ncbi:MAG TPA: anhydro-N-acetylmuramic acid kinase [Holophagaceae bacterium]|nr:anhydro-N-acetylmuramic acid kinase [Holophagaceae bacterium]
MTFRLDRPVPWRVLGLMSGTSADGVDAALIEVDPGGFDGGTPFLGLLGHAQSPYPEDLRAAAVAAAGNRLDPAALCVLQRRLGDHHAAAAAALCANLEVQPDLASLHGQTVQHHPDHGATLQLADPHVLVERLRCPVVFDLRRRDMALGGQGAPLVPKTELWLHGADRPFLALNLGGIANATIWDGARLHAWDLGPGMSLLDLAAKRWLDLDFDPSGGHATGVADERLIAAWLEHPYFQAPPPKSTGREVFGEAWLERQSSALEGLPLQDRLATLAAFTASAVAHELRRVRLPLSGGLLSGGGAHHQRLREELGHRTPALHWRVDESLPPGSREAVSWALLGAASAAGVPGNLPEVTGASAAAVLGAWVFP